MTDTGELQYRQGKYPHCITPFGTYWAGYTHHPIISDIRATHGEPYSRATVFWAKRNDELLYAGFSAQDAFEAMEKDFQQKKLAAQRKIGAALNRYFG